MDTSNSRTRQSTRFNLGDFAAREQRRTQRLVRAAYGVGHTHAWFVALSRAEQEGKVRERVDEALDAHAERLAQSLLLPR